MGQNQRPTVPPRHQTNPNPRRQRSALHRQQTPHQQPRTRHANPSRCPRDSLLGQQR